ncbi:hypothetical protein BGP77_03750 [Saccharospirillum sp. MSK14-1]|uniref:YheU family protein n=1 Tax=Saccharospirillum sp. MSK14-1 TaxID=1897632 RepID=UPI000D47357B|nr:YheU family protein [Saccharospirillum sp. MSK14-1]PTY36422.1 hypothetical protein BGP77_03750 [Saccharospirillum sp. MSK14-1]
MIIPFERLERETLEQVIREWLMRQGEDWGVEEGSLESAIERARQALSDGRLVLYWDATEENLTLADPRTVPSDDEQESYE